MLWELVNNNVDKFGALQLSENMPARIIFRVYCQPYNNTVEFLKCILLTIKNI